ALSRYMSSLFESKISDEKRVSSAVYIEGDGNTDIVSNDDIEALIANLGQK
ncbi:MAG: chemotaxis protein, partial [Campylobacter sp.]|nr:chemotaxis protein [Campylobacter sp.]